MLSPLHLLQGFVDADGDVVVLPFAHDELHVFAVEPGAATESLQVNCRGAREDGAGLHPEPPKPRQGGLQRKHLIKYLIKHISRNSAKPPTLEALEGGRHGVGGSQGAPSEQRGMGRAWKHY